LIARKGGVLYFHEGAGGTPRDKPPPVLNRARNFSRRRFYAALTLTTARTPECHDHQHGERIIEVARQWARAQKNILAVALVGSDARKTARPASDIDLVMLTYEPTSFHTDTTWCHAIDWAALNARPLKCKDEDYGLLWSHRLLLDYNGGEIEFGFVSPAWADVHPVDTGTRRVIADRCRVLHAPRGLLKRLCAAVDRGVERRAGGCLGSSTAYDTRLGRDPANPTDLHRPRSRRLRPPISGAYGARQLIAAGSGEGEAPGRGRGQARRFRRARRPAAEGQVSSRRARSSHRRGSRRARMRAGPGRRRRSGRRTRSRSGRSGSFRIPARWP
jgi:hypothetical protein